MIAALFVETDGCYYGLPDVDPWDEARDARRYAGPWSVVAHPPCERWGRYWSGGPSAKVRRVKGDDGGCFTFALDAVRRWGGVLEHPEASHAWEWHGLNKPPRSGGWMQADDVGGWTCCVEQGWYGHVARKLTWLYACHTELLELQWGRAPGDFVRLDEGFHSIEERRRAVKTGACQRLSKKQRAATPKPFRDLLLKIASLANMHTNGHSASSSVDVKRSNTKHFKGILFMANEVELFKNSNLALANLGKYKDAFQRASASAPQMGGAPILRLGKDGIWRYGQDMTEVEEGSLWAANPASFFKGYICWPEGTAGANKPLGKQMRNIMSDDPPIIAANLPDLGGKWMENVQFDLACTNGEDKGTMVQFVANAMGGVERWYTLVTAISHQYDVDPTKLVPIISLEHDGYFHPNKSFGARHPVTKEAGWIVKPKFTVVSWASIDGSTQSKLEEPQEEEAPAQAGRRKSTITNGSTEATLNLSHVGEDNLPKEPDPVVRRRRRAAV